MATYTYFVYTSDALNFSGGSLTLDSGFDAVADRRVIELTDDDGTLDGDFTNNEVGIDANQTATVYNSDGSTLATVGGSTYVDDQIYVDFQYILTGNDGSAITVYVLEIGGQVVGYLPTAPLDPNVTYGYTTANVISDDELTGFYRWWYNGYIGADETDPISYTDGSGNSNIIGAVVCFTPDSLVQTPRGPKAIGDLQIGDHVLTLDSGYQPVRWLHRRHLSTAQLRAQPQFCPVVIEADAFGPGKPQRQMRVSPQHRIWVQNHLSELFFANPATLAPAKGLINGRSVWQDAACAGVDYIHVMFDQHEVMLADGLYSESYHPGDWATASLAPDARAELFGIFPDLARNAAFYGPTRYPALTTREARLLCA